MFLPMLVYCFHCTQFKLCTECQTIQRTAWIDKWLFPRNAPSLIENLPHAHFTTLTLLIQIQTQFFPTLSWCISHVLTKAIVANIDTHAITSSPSWILSSALNSKVIPNSSLFKFYLPTLLLTSMLTSLITSSTTFSITSPLKSLLTSLYTLILQHRFDMGSLILFNEPLLTEILSLHNGILYSSALSSNSSKNFLMYEKNLLFFMRKIYVIVKKSWNGK